MADPGALEAQAGAGRSVVTVAEEFIKRHVVANRRERSANEPPPSSAGNSSPTAGPPISRSGAGTSSRRWTG